MPSYQRFVARSTTYMRSAPTSSFLFYYFASGVVSEQRLAGNVAPRSIARFVVKVLFGHILSATVQVGL